jgi:hypothetical protein
VCCVSFLCVSYVSYDICDIITSFLILFSCIRLESGRHKDIVTKDQIQADAWFDALWTTRTVTEVVKRTCPESNVVIQHVQTFEVKEFNRALAGQLTRHLESTRPDKIAGMNTLFIACTLAVAHLESCGRSLNVSFLVFLGMRGMRVYVQSSVLTANVNDFRSHQAQI